MKRKYSFFILVLLLSVSSLVAVKPPQYWFVFLNRNPDRIELPPNEAAELQKGHLANIDRLYVARTIVAAGPFEGGGGMFVARADSRQEVIDSIATDPAVKAGRFLMEYIPWEPVNGGFCLYEEPFSMVSYYFVRLTYPPPADSAAARRDEYNNAYAEMRDSVKSNYNLLLDGQFKDNTGAVLIIHSDSEDFEEIIDDSRMVDDLDAEFEVKKLYIAKGTFCEK